MEVSHKPLEATPVFYENRSLAERIAATSIVNQALLKCLLLGIPVSSDNLIRLVGDFFDPSDRRYARLIDKILLTIDEVLAVVGKSGRRLDG